MRRNALKALALALVFSLLGVSMPAATAAATSARSLSMKALLAGGLANFSGPRVLTRQSGEVKTIASPSGASVVRDHTVTLSVRVAPATQQALNDLNCSYANSKVTFLSASYSVSKSYLTVNFTFKAGGDPSKTSVKFYSGARKSVKDTTTVTIKPIPVVAVTLNSYTSTLVAGQTMQLTASVLPENADNQQVRWTSSNRRVATVTAGGLVTTLKPGAATIVATSVSGGKRATCSFKVTSPNATPAPTPMPAATPSPVKNTTTYRALLIGNEAYSPRLRGPYNDLTAMSAVLGRSTIGGKKYESVTVLKDQKKAQVLSDIAAMAKKSDGDDVTLLYYPGHGAQGAATEPGPGLWCVDKKLLSVPELKAALDKVPGTVIVILDSCFSGMFIGKGATAAEAKALGKSFDAQVMGAFKGSSKDGPTAKGLTSNKYQVITACRKAETSVSVGYTRSGSTTYVGLATYFIAVAGGYDLFNPSDTKFYGDCSPKDGVDTFAEVFTFADTYVDQFVASYDSESLTQDMQYSCSDIGFPLFGRT